MTTSEPTMSDVLREAIEAGVARIHTQIPGTVVSYDRTTQRAVVDVAIRMRYLSETGDLTEYDPPAIAGVPVMFPGAGDVSITWDLAPGDDVLLVICERSIDEWKTNGSTRRQTAGSVRRFDLSDAIAIPSVRPTSIPSTGYRAGALVLAAADVRIGSSAASSTVALSPLVDTALSQLATALASWTPIAGDGGAALKTIVSALIATGWPAATGATRVRAE